MVESLKPGIHSSPSLRPANEVCATLSVRLKSPPLSLVVAALGTDADLFLVGGTVRDTILGDEVTDFDLTTKLPASETLTRLQEHNIHALDVGMRHGTIIAAIDGHNIEITTFRKIAEDGSVQTGSSIEEDLAGRDFTINAIAFSVNSSELVDPCGGYSDLEKNLIRTVGSPEARFKEDPLRLLRLVRFGPTQGRYVDSSTETAAQATVPAISSVSPERIRVELENILMGKCAGSGLRYLAKIDGLKQVLPEVVPAIGVEQNEFHIEDVFDHTISVIERTPPDPILRWAALFHDLGKPATFSVGDDKRIHFYGHERISTELARQVMTRLKFSHADADAIALIVKEHMRPFDCGPPGTRRILRDTGLNYERWRRFKIADAPPAMSDDEFTRKLARFDAMVEDERNRLKGSVYGTLAIDGNDIIALGIKPGPKLGGLLKQTQEAVIENPELNEKQALLEFVKKMITDQGL